MGVVPQHLVCLLLLGSPPANVSARLMADPTAHRDILRATAHFIRLMVNPPRAARALAVNSPLGQRASSFYFQLLSDISISLAVATFAPLAQRRAWIRRFADHRAP